MLILFSGVNTTYALTLLSITSLHCGVLNTPYRITWFKEKVACVSRKNVWRRKGKGATETVYDWHTTVNSDSEGQMGPYLYSVILAYA